MTRHTPERHKTFNPPMPHDSKISCRPFRLPLPYLTLLTYFTQASSKENKQGLEKTRKPTQKDRYEIFQARRPISISMNPAFCAKDFHGLGRAHPFAQSSSLCVSKSSKKHGHAEVIVEAYDVFTRKRCLYGFPASHNVGFANSA